MDVIHEHIEADMALVAEGKGWLQRTDVTVKKKGKTSCVRHLLPTPL